MAELSIQYQGATIAGLSASGEKTLHTGGRFCEGDISLRYERPVPDLRELDIYVADFLSAPPTVSEGTLNTLHRILVP